MSRLRRAVLVTVAALLTAGALSVPAASADVVLPFTNYQVGGTLTVKKLDQSVTLPPGSTFNGQANLTTSQLSGDVFVPEFTSTIRVLGIPTQVTTKLEQVQPVQGSVALNGTNLSIHSSTTAILRIKRLRLGLLSVATTCRTAEPLVLKLDYEGPLPTPIELAFDGETTIPKLTGCGLLGPTLGLLLSGPGNKYHVEISPPAGA
jgi:hypothetical protein